MPSNTTAETFRVVHVVSSLGRGGAERCIVDLLRARSKNKFSHSVVCLGDRGSYSNEVESLGIPLHHLKIKERGVVSAVKTLISIRKAIQPSIVCTWLYHADLMGTVLWFLSGRSFALIWNVRRTVIHDEVEPFHRKVVRRLLSLLSWAPSLIIANSVRGVECHKTIGYAPSQWRVIPNGVDTDVFQKSAVLREEFRTRWQISDDEVVLLCVGRLSQVKGQDRALEAFRVLRTRGQKVRMVFVGRGVPSWDAAMFPGVLPPSVSEGVILQDEVGDLCGLYSAADILLLPSRAEGHPQVVTEALACELPVVAFDVGDVRTIVQRCGAIATSLQEFIANVESHVGISPAQRAFLGREGRARIMSCYRIDQMVGQFENAMNDLVSKNSAVQGLPRMAGGA